MKKVVTLIFAMVLIYGCELGSSDPIELTAESTINGNIDVTIPQTNGTAMNYTESISQNLDGVIANFSDVKDVNITSLSYTYVNPVGNSNAVIQNATININGNTVATISDVNVTEQASNSAIFQITDTTVLEELETLFLTSSQVNIQFSGSVLSDEGPIDFNIQLRIVLSVTF